VAKKAKKENAAPEVDVTGLLRLPQGPVDLSAYDPRATPGFGGDKDAGKVALAERGPRLADLQERLFAHGRTGGKQRVLLVVQGMDSSGKGGTIRHVVGQVDPQGVAIRSFRAPTKEELAHDFLWRIRKAVPGPGMIGVFDRSHYEDVLIARVQQLVEPRVWSRRYAAINRFEERLAASSCHVVKVFLHISPEEQRERLMARLDDPTKHWKYNPGDIDQRGRWLDYQVAYAAALEKCNTSAAPWHLVPADRKWYRNWAIMALLLEKLDSLDLEWPPADFDVAAEKERLAAT
jgi:PPK2 family polyphosphate:nucleotide phosphotransferase